MATEKDALNLRYSLVRNTLPETDGYHAVISHVGTVDEYELYGRTAARRPGLEASTVGLVVSSICRTAAEMLSERQYRIALGEVTFELAIPGSTDSVDGTLSGPAYVAVRASSPLRNAADGLTPVYAAADGDRTEVFSVESLSGAGSGWISGTETFRLAGVNLSASGDGEYIKVNAADGTEAIAEVTAEDGAGRFITARLPAALPPGKGKVTLTTRGKRTPEGELMPCTKNVTILAGDEPPTPAPTGDEPEIERGYSEGEGHPDGQVFPYYAFILQGVNLDGAAVKIGYTEEGAYREVDVPDEKLTVTDTVITIASDSVELEDAIAAGGTVTFKATTEHGTATYEAEVQS